MEWKVVSATFSFPQGGKTPHKKLLRVFSEVNPTYLSVCLFFSLYIRPIALCNALATFGENNRFVGRAKVSEISTKS